MRWQRFVDIFPWRIATLLALLFGLQSLSWWIWFRWEVPPLERYYFRAYFNCTGDAKHPGAETEIEWLFKTAPGRKRQPIIAADVVSGRNGNLPLQLSLAAMEQGWTEIERSSPQRVNSAELEQFLQEDFYDSRDFRQLLAEPLLDGCVLLLVPIFLVFVLKEELALEWSRLRRAIRAPGSRSDDAWNSSANRHWITEWFQLSMAMWKWLENLRPRRANPDLQTARFAEANRVPIEGRTGSGQGLLPKTVLGPNPGAQAAEMGTSKTPSTKHSINPRKRPLKRHPIFPGSAGVRTSNRKPKPWDESQWID